jgi:hypothetical protein
MNFRSTMLGLLAVSASILAACASPSMKTEPAAAPAPMPVAAKPLRAPKDIGMSEILDDPKKLAVLRKHAPAIADHEQIGMARGMSLADIAGYAEAGLTPQMVTAIVEDLSQL